MFTMYLWNTDYF